MKSFADKIKKRDNFTCRHCGRTDKELPFVQGQKLTLHHIKPVCKKPNLKKDMDNVITLCRECHNKVHKIERRKKKDKVLHKINNKLPEFKKYLEEIGAEILSLVLDKYELQRFKIYGKTCIVYAAGIKKQKQGYKYSYANHLSEQTHKDFLDIPPWEEIPKEKKVEKKKIKVKPLTKQEYLLFLYILLQLDNAKNHIRDLINTFHREKMIQTKYLYRILADSLSFLKGKQKYKIIDSVENVEEARKVYRACLQLQKYLMRSGNRKGEFIG